MSCAGPGLDALQEFLVYSHFLYTVGLILAQELPSPGNWGEEGEGRENDRKKEKEKDREPCKLITFEEVRQHYIQPLTQ